jgi:hypothetical protein
VNDANEPDERLFDVVEGELDESSDDEEDDSEEQLAFLSRIGSSDMPLAARQAIVAGASAPAIPIVEAEAVVTRRRSTRY